PRERRPPHARRRDARARRAGPSGFVWQRGRMGVHIRWCARHAWRLVPRPSRRVVERRACRAGRLVERTRPAVAAEPLVAVRRSLRGIPHRKEHRMSAPVTRRTFVQTTTAAAAALAFPFGVRASGSDVIRVGVIGCGGRGTGAARDCMRGSDGVAIVAMGDLMPDRLAQSRESLAQAVADSPALAPKFSVTDDRCFTGFDAYQKVIDSGVDMVILATPPGFRPAHLAPAVKAGKHVFPGKPV